MVNVLSRTASVAELGTVGVDPAVVGGVGAHGRRVAGAVGPRVHARCRRSNNVVSKCDSFIIYTCIHGSSHCRSM